MTVVLVPGAVDRDGGGEVVVAVVACGEPVEPVVEEALPKEITVDDAVGTTEMPGAGVGVKSEPT